MARDEWYRRTTWSERDKVSFLKRLTRSRKDFNKAQYLQIQALYLQRESKPPLYREAIELIDYLLEYCPHPFSLPSAYMQKAQCLDALGDVSGATQAFLLSLAAEKVTSGIKTTAPLEFAMFVIRHDLKEHYDEVLASLRDNTMLTIFPSRQYAASAALAIIAADNGHKEKARQFARKALDAARITNNGLRHHSKLGLVDEPDSRLQARLEEIAGG